MNYYHTGKSSVTMLTPSGSSFCLGKGDPPRISRLLPEHAGKMTEEVDDASHPMIHLHNRADCVPGMLEGLVTECQDREAQLFRPPEGSNTLPSVARR